MIEERHSAMADGVEAGLFKGGADEAVVNQVASEGLRGVVNGMLQDVDTLEEQTAISTYIRTNGNLGAELISSERLEVLEQFRPYMNLETSKPVIAEMTQVNAGLNAVRRAEQARLDAEAEVRKRAALLAFTDAQGAARFRTSASASRRACSARRTALRPALT